MHRRYQVIEDRGLPETEVGRRSDPIRERAGDGTIYPQRAATYVAALLVFN